MPTRYKLNGSRPFPFVRLRPFAALREKFKDGYGFSDLRADIMAGAIVAMVAIPLAMVLAIASGVPPQHGLYTVIIGGGAVAMLGGSRFQVTGPTAAFVVILAPIAHKFGLGGLLFAGLMAGIMLVLMGVARMGRLIQFIPHPVTTGFTAGIAVVIATLQLKDMLGLRIHEMPETFLEKVIALFKAMGTASPMELIIGGATLAALIAWPKFNKKVPAPLAVLTLVSVAVGYFKSLFPGVGIDTIGTRFPRGISQSLPHFSFPWSFVGANGRAFSLTLDNIESLILPAFAIAMLGAIESLLSAVVADGMAHTKHDPDAELVALGTGNILCPFFGGIPATGAIARTAANIRFGAKSPISAVFHALFTLMAMLVLAPYVAYLPMAALAALMILVAYNMSERKHFFHILRVAPKSDVIVLLLCFTLTVIFDMVVGVTVGVVLSSLLFMQRMAAVTSAQVLNGNGSHPHLKDSLSNEVLLYEIAGPLFFGAAEKAIEAISGITDNIRVVIFSMEAVPAMDITGLIAFESAIRKLSANNRQVYLVGIKAQPMALLKKADFLERHGNVQVCPSVDEAISLDAHSRERSRLSV